MLKNISLLHVFQFFLLNFILFQYLYSQSTDVLWTKTFGGSDYDIVGTLPR